MMGTEYRVIYSKRRTVGITVERDGAVVVRAPQGLSQEKLQAVVDSRRRWIEEKRASPQKYAKIPAPGKELVSGESMLFLGRSYTVDVVDTKDSEIRFEDRFIVPSALGADARGQFRQWYYAAAQRHLLPRAAERAGTLGVTPKRISVVDNRFRWGSCTPAGNVNLNWRLVKAPVPVADYVSVHELAHLLEPSHSDRFWSIVRSQVAGADPARRWLREHGQLLEQDL